MSAEGIRFVDTTIRDGHQSLWAENMTTGMMLPGADALDRAGFDAIELISSSHLKKCVRELKEDPWARVRLMRERIERTPLRLNAGRFSAFDLTPRSMYRLFMERMAAMAPSVAPLGITPPEKLILRAMKSRWGTCSNDGRVTLNLKLMQLDIDLLDYVIVHELCHLREFNHSPRFYALLDAAMPDWKQRRRTLQAIDPAF